MRATCISLFAIALAMVPASAFAQDAKPATSAAEPAEGPPIAPPPEVPSPKPLEAKPPTLTNPPSTSAQASDGVAPDGSTPGTRLAPDSLVDTTMSRSWSEGRVRGFLATTIDVGWTYLRPRASLGYGKPFGTWFGIDANPILSGAGFGGYAGLRLALPRVDIRFGPRFFYAFDRYYLQQQSTYDRVDLESEVTGKHSQVVTLEAEVEGSIPVGPGDITLLGSISDLLNVPAGDEVFEETLHVIVKPPLVWRTRLGYLFRFGSYRQHSIGIVGDALDVPKRDDSLSLRLGPIVRIVLSRRVEIRGSFVPTIYSPDHIGLVGGDFTELGFRYRWATE